MKEDFMLQIIPKRAINILKSYDLGKEYHQIVRLKRTDLTNALLGVYKKMKSQLGYRH
ncbi:MAG TPA: hypothetical protein PK335_12345 [Draconibacterium sp.]|nr:hypothetical protein [Draconibacterium sp.]